MADLYTTETGPLLPRELAAAAHIAATAPDAWREGDLAAALADAHRVCLAARAVQPGEEPLLQGFICLRVLEGEAELEMLAVHPDARRRGMGRALLRAGLAAAAQKGAARCLLELRAGNTAALHLYETMGFAVLARRPALYAQPREDGLCMGRALEGDVAEEAQ